MRNGREAVYNALLELLQTILPTPQVQTFSRVWRPVTDYSAIQLPACVLDETRENYKVQKIGLSPVYRLHVDLWLYLEAPQISQIPGQETLIPMTAINTLLDLLDNSPLNNPPTMVPAAGLQTLNGLVQHVWIEGDILKVAGGASSVVKYNLARVPILILTA
jgi:hypothetical protein